MKNKRAFIVTVLIIAILLLGIGYAAVANQTLTITGSATATASDANFNVQFDTSVTPSKTGKTTVATHDTATTATMTVVGLENTSETATATFTIKNASPDLKASVAVPTVSISGANASYFNVTTDWGSSAKVLNANGGTTTVTVTVKLATTPITDIPATTFTVSFVASAVENS